jgi:hypothetical protein
MVLSSCIRLMFSTDLNTSKPQTWPISCFDLSRLEKLGNRWKRIPNEENGEQMENVRDDVRAQAKETAYSPLPHIFTSHMRVPHQTALMLFDNTRRLLQLQIPSLLLSSVFCSSITQFFHVHRGRSWCSFCDRLSVAPPASSIKLSAITVHLLTNVQLMLQLYILNLKFWVYWSNTYCHSRN